MGTRKLIVSIGLILVSLPAWANSGGPDRFGYTWVDDTEADGPSYQWIEPSDAAVVVLANNTSRAENIELAVPWGGIYGAKTRELRVSRNGYLTDLLTDSGNDETNDCPLPAAPSVGGGNRIYVLHDNLELDTSDGLVTYEYFPLSPHSLHDCGVHVITWVDVHHATGDPTRFSFQALLFDNFDILLQYSPGNPEQGGGSTTGMQNASATVGLNVYCDLPKLADNTAILIRPPIATVNTIEDQLDTPAGAALSLREALRDAPNGSRIEFDYSSSIRPLIDLSAAGGGQGSRITLNNRNLALDGTTVANPPTLFGANSVRHLLLQNGTHLSLCDIRLTHGRSNNLFANGAAGSTRVLGGSSLVASYCEFLQNFTANEGGALFIDDSETAVHLHRCRLLGNAANAAGGAIAVRETATLRTFETNFWLNRSLNSAGGALSLRNATVELEFCEFAENESGANGGGIVANVDVTASLHACTFDSNAALNGGALAVENGSGTSSPPAVVGFSRCTFSENVATATGGVLYENSRNSLGQTATPNFAHCTLYRNYAGLDGGACAMTDGEVQFQGTCVAQNTVRGQPGNLSISGSGTVTSFGDNLESEDDMGFTIAADLQNLDPLLTPLGYHGGWVRTCFPLEGSPLLDAAIDGGAATVRDARGILSFQDGDPTTPEQLPGRDWDDIGAVELAPPVTLDPGASETDLVTALESLANGASLRLGSNARFIFTSPLSLDEGRMLFIEGSQGATVMEGLTLVTQSQTAFHNLIFDGHSSSTARFSSAGIGSIARGLSFHDCEFRNHARISAAALTSGLEGKISLTNCLFEANSSRGIIDLTGDFSVIRDCHFTRNHPQGTGNHPQREVLRIEKNALLTRCSFTEHTINSGTESRNALIAFRSFDRGQAMVSRIRNCTFADNFQTTTSNVSSQMGAITVSSFSSNVPPFILLDHLTFAGNRFASPTPGQLVGSTTTRETFDTIRITNCLFANEGTAPFFNLGSSGGNLADTNLPEVKTSDFENTLAELGPLSRGRGLSRHLPLLPTSPAIDAALNQRAGGVDGRGGIRYVDAVGNGSALSDIGAVEAGFPLTITTEEDEDDGALGSGMGDSLRECMDAAKSGPVSLTLAPGLTDLELLTTLSISTPHQVDFNLAGDPVTIRQSGSDGFALIELLGASCQFWNHIVVDCEATFLAAADKSHLHLNRAAIERLNPTFVTASDEARILATGLSVVDLTRSGNSPLFTGQNNSRLALEDSVFARINNPNTNYLVSHPFASLRADLIRCHLVENALGSGLFTTTGYLRMNQCTVYRNGSQGRMVNGPKAQLRLHDSIFAGNFGGSLFQLLGGETISEGGNLSNLGDSFLVQEDDLTFYHARLAPLFDYDGDGLRECPPLAASPIFATQVGATAPPRNLIVVNTTADQNNEPAGPAVSLREAIRDIAPGGTILFAENLNNGTFVTGDLFPAHSMTIDASNLPSGVSIQGRLVVTDTNVTLALHALHMRDNTPSGIANGGSVSTTGNLVANLSVFSGNSSFRFGGAIEVEGDSILENCTFAQLSSTAQAPAIKIFGNGEHHFSYCTFGECSSPSGGVIDLASSASLSLFGNLFLGNSRIPVAFGTPQLSEFNIYDRAVPYASTTDLESISSGFFTAFDDYGGYGPSYGYLPATGITDHITDLGAGRVQSPETDGRGFMRVIGPGAEPGAHELGGEFAFGSDPANLQGDDDDLPGWWELQNGLDPTATNDTSVDSDGDGSDLLEEFQWRTNPDNAFSFFRCRLEDDQLIWSTEPGFEYQIESNSDLVGSWSPVVTILGNGGDRSFTINPSVSSPPRDFFRIRRVSP